MKIPYKAFINESISSFENQPMARNIPDVGHAN